MSLPYLAPLPWTGQRYPRSVDVLDRDGAFICTVWLPVEDLFPDRGPDLTPSVVIHAGELLDALRLLLAAVEPLHQLTTESVLEFDPVTLQRSAAIASQVLAKVEGGAL